MYHIISFKNIKKKYTLMLITKLNWGPVENVKNLLLNNMNAI